MDYAVGWLLFTALVWPGFLGRIAAQIAHAYRVKTRELEDRDT
jgi:hypothetical protein